MTRDKIVEIFDGAIDDLLTQVQGLGVTLDRTAEEVHAYAAERLAHIETLAADPDVMLDVIRDAAGVEAGNIELFAALRAVEAGDEVDIAARAALVSGIRTVIITTAKVLVLI